MGTGYGGFEKNMGTGYVFFFAVIYIARVVLVEHYAIMPILIMSGRQIYNN